MEYNFKGFSLNCFVIDGEPWFSTNDLADILGYKNRTAAISRHTSPDDRKILKFKDYGSDAQFSNLWVKQDYMDKSIVNESGVYCLIFGSAMEQAVEFKIWVTREVLPRLRKNGGYIIGEENLSAKQQEALKRRVNKLADKVEKLDTSNRMLRSKWHKAVSERENLKGKRKNDKELLKKTRKNLDILNRDADDNYEILTRCLKDLASAEQTIKTLHRKLDEANGLTPVTPVKQIKTSERILTVDKEGRVIQIA